MTLAERILAQLEDRPLSVDRLAKALSLRPMQRPELNRELTLLHRAKRIIYGRGEWSIADAPEMEKRADAPFPMMPGVEDDPVPTTERAPRPNSPEHHSTAKDRRAAILTMLEGGAMARRDIAERLGLDSQDRNLDNALGRLRAAGQINQLSRGVWALGDTPQSDLKTALKRMLDTNPAASADAGPNEPGPLVDETDQEHTPLSATGAAVSTPSNRTEGGESLRSQRRVLTNGVTNEAEKINTPVVSISTCGIDKDASPEVMSAIGEMARRFVDRGKYDKPKQVNFRIQPGANGFIVHREFATIATDPPGVFNRFDDLIEFLRGEYFA
jgi:hypothetical protein